MCIISVRFVRFRVYDFFERQDRNIFRNASNSTENPSYHLRKETRYKPKINTYAISKLVYYVFSFQIRISFVIYLILILIFSVFTFY